jgi:hypothetical protein
MTIEIIIVHSPDYNEQANLPVVSLLSLRKKDGLSMGFKHNRVLTTRSFPRTRGLHGVEAEIVLPPHLDLGTA